MRTQRERIAHDREQLTRQLREASAVLMATPEWAAFAQINTRFTEHWIAYGDSLDGPEPVGIFGS